MQKLFDNVGMLDERCYQKYHLSEDILMEHAASGIASYIESNFAKGSHVLIVCGSGNNGADGIASARILHKNYRVTLLYAKSPKSPMALLQQKRISAMNIMTCHEVIPCDVIVDAIVGTGFRGMFDSEISILLDEMNQSQAYKIACDIPSGMAFYADTTLTMGALKKSMFCDSAKEFVGDIEVVELGIARILYESQTDWYQLDLEDMQPPYRESKNTHKGSYGHLGVIMGDKSGAAILSAKSAFRFGAGVVTLISNQDISTPETLIHSCSIPENTTALALGMGLGEVFDESQLDAFLDNDLPLIVDADMFHSRKIVDILKRKNIVLTPHPKEFVSLLKLCNIVDISTKELQQNRFEYVELFYKKYPHAILLLKGSNVIIAGDGGFYINPHGTQALAKGGSGDVLGGLIGALLAQGYSPLEAAINASLAHTKVASEYKKADFSLTPNDLIDGLANL